MAVVAEYASPYLLGHAGHRRLIGQYMKGGGCKTDGITGCWLGSPSIPQYVVVIMSALPLFHSCFSNYAQWVPVPSLQILNIRMFSVARQASSFVAPPLVVVC